MQISFIIIIFLISQEAQEGNVADEGPAHLEMISYSAMVIHYRWYV